MSEAQDRELEDEARSLLRAVRIPPAVPADARARARRRMALALPLAAVATGVGVSQGSVHRSWLARAIDARVPAWSLLASFAAGGALALAAARRVAPPAPSERPTPVVIAPAPVSAPPTPTVTRPEAPAAPVLPVAPAPPSAPSARASATPASAPRASAAERGPTTLEAERALLDMARTALGRGDGEHALRATEEHARAFPHGVLSEEREAMSIQALRLLHRDDEASARLDRFRARFPTSLLRPALEASPSVAGDGGSP